MTKVLAGITTSVDGYVAGPGDGPGKGLGEGGEPLHYWVFGGAVDVRRGAQRRGDRRGRGVAEGGDVAARRRRRRALDLRSRRPLGRREPVGHPVLHRDASARGAAGGPSVHVRLGRRRGRRAGTPKPPATRTSTSWAAPTSFARLSKPACRRADDHHRAGRARRWQASVRGLLDFARAGAPRRPSVAVRDVHRLPGEARRGELIKPRGRSARTCARPWSSSSLSRVTSLERGIRPRQPPVATIPECDSTAHRASRRRAAVTQGGVTALSTRPRPG